MYRIIIATMIGMLRVIYFPMKLRRTKKKVVFLSRQSNTISIDMKLLSEELKKQDPDVVIVYRLKKMEKGIGNLFAYGFHLLGDLWNIADAAVAICDTYSIPISCLSHKKDLYVIQIWHALGALKKFGLQSVGKKEGRNEELSKAMHMHEGYDCVFAPSKATAKFYEEAFGTPMENMKLLTLPRVDYILQRQEEVREAFLKEHEKLRGVKLVLYLPTFREGEEEIVKQLRDAFSKAENMKLIVSLHPLSKGYEKLPYHTYDLMKIAHVIITDYSASAFESAVLRKPLYFYVPDYDTYKENRGLNISLEEEMPEATYEDAQKLVEVIQKEEYNRSMLEDFRRRYVENTDRCTAKMASYILERIDESLSRKMRK